MCRLLGYVARQPLSVIDVLGEDDFEAFTALTAVHGDGWGMAWRDPTDHTLRSVTSAVSALRDPAYARLTQERLGRAGMVHLRWASPGLRVAPENTHPFVEDGYAFAHNGNISPIDRLERLLKPATRAALRGSTDSERYFRFALQCIAERGDDEDGLRWALDVLTREFPEASLNAFLLTPTHMYGVHINSRASTPIQGLRKLFTSDDELPYRHTDDYFAMDFRLTRNAVHVISSGIDPQGWTPVPDNTAASVNLSTLELRRLSI
ncbi:class II glutamine amidotransferase [Nocardioides gansuensis]|uniref:Class II glutamine amidotransferase n=1 Tax=Nocardioides gansuensis TaxID=2138300 RepID=A0A2T8F8X0_9ACTN|nr:class II glutamine amidotransferase [Nocardioides gansuensis]PVG82130.1 class II glutamine amidotransferase [Nocardioides gansuensis]